MCLEVDRVCILDGEDTSSKILSPLCFMLHLRPTGWEGILDLMMLQMSFTLGSIELSFLLSTLLIFLLFSSLSLHMLPSFCCSLILRRSPDPDVCSLSELLPDSCKRRNAQEGLTELQLTFRHCRACTYAGCLMMAYSWNANICTEKQSPSDRRE